MKFQEIKWGKGFKINLSYETRLSIEMLCFQRGALLWEVQLVIGYLSGNFWVEFLSKGYIRSAECILNGCIGSAEDSRRPQPKLRSGSSNKGSGRSNSKRQKGSVFAVYLRTVGTSLPEGLVRAGALPCNHAPWWLSLCSWHSFQARPRNSQFVGEVQARGCSQKAVCKRPAWFGGQVLVLWTKAMAGTCS